jgi:hypothetical protein
MEEQSLHPRRSVHLGASEAVHSPQVVARWVVDHRAAAGVAVRCSAPLLVEIAPGEPPRVDALAPRALVAHLDAARSCRLHDEEAQPGGPRKGGRHGSTARLNRTPLPAVGAVSDQVRHQEAVALPCCCFRRLMCLYRWVHWSSDLRVLWALLPSR